MASPEVKRAALRVAENVIGLVEDAGGEAQLDHSVLVGSVAEHLISFADALAGEIEKRMHRDEDCQVQEEPPSSTWRQMVSGRTFVMPERGGPSLYGRGYRAAIEDVGKAIGWVGAEDPVEAHRRLVEEACARGRRDAMPAFWDELSEGVQNALLGIADQWARGNFLYTQQRLLSLVGVAAEAGAKQLGGGS